MAQSDILNSLPIKQKALVGTVDGGFALSNDAGMPQMEDDMVLVQTKAVSVNPVDTKMVGDYITPGAISGCDFAGIVVAVGPAVSAISDIRVGDRVCGAVMGMNPLQPNVGAFATYVGARADRIMRIPQSGTYEAAAAMSTSFMTAGLALFKSLGLPGTPRSPSTAAKPIPVLVNGGATATGTAAMQLLRLSGFLPIATCSSASSALAISYGAEVTFDYRDPGCAADIRAYTKNSLRYALDCITTVDSMKLCYAAIGRVGGRYTALDPFPEVVAHTRKIVKADWVLGPIMLGRDISWPAPHGRPADEEMGAFGAEWVKNVEELVEDGKLRHHPISVESGGIDGVLNGMDLIRNHKVSGKKLIYRLEGPE